MSETTPAREARREALGVSVLYGLVAAAWIVLSDIVLGPDVPPGETFGDIAKGLGFVLVTSVVLYLWVRRQTLRRLRLSEQYRSLSEQAPDLVYRLRLRPERRFEYASPAARAITGHGPEEFYRNPDGILETIHPEDRPRLEQVLADPERIAEAAAGGEPLEMRWRHADGRMIWTENRVTPIRDEEGRIVGVQGIARDITARREAQERTELLATAVEAAGEAVIITDRTGRVEYVNPAFTRISGYEADQVIGENPRILNSGRQPGSFYRELWGTITAGRTFRGEMVNRRRDGRLYDQQCTITPVRDVEGRVSHFVAVARDVTVEREMDERVRIAQKMHAVGQLAAGVAHDFRNLLNVIQVHATALRQRATAGPGASTTLSTDDTLRIGEVWEAAERGVALVRKLLTVGRRDELALVPTDLAAIVQHLRPSFRAALPDTVGLSIEVGADIPPVLGDATALEQILLNLVANARDAVEGDGQVRIEVSETGGRGPADGSRRAGADDDGRPQHHGRHVRIAVGDTGDGMEPETLRRVFEPFFTTKPEGRGTGLGLASVRSLVERHGGIVSARSRPNEGSTFELFFPVAPEVSPGAQEGEEDVVPPGRLEALPRGSEAILLVEDEDPLRSLGTRILSGLGYRVTALRDGEEALSWLGEERDVDLVVTDLVMPRMDGRTLFERSRERGWSVPFLFMSGYGSEDLAWHPNPDRLRVIVEKPWTVEELAHRVREALDG